MDDNVKKYFRKTVAALGPRSFGPPIDEVKKQLGLDELINLSLNENAWGPSPMAIEAAKEAAENMNRYPDPAATELRRALAEKFGVGIDQVIHGNGGSELISLIAEAFIDDGDELISLDPTFRQFQEATRIMGGIVHRSDLKEHRMDLADMASKLTPKTKIVLLVNPNNPTGDFVKKKEVEKFLDKVGKDRIIVFDNAYAEFVDDEEYPHGIEYIEQGYKVVVMRTFSKAYGLAGLRMGYAISSKEIISHMDPARNVFNGNKVAQVAAVAALKDEEHLNKIVQYVKEEKKYYYDELDQMGLYYVPTHANFILVKVGCDDMKLWEAMRNDGVVVAPGSWSDYQGFVRITFGTREQNEKCIALLKKHIPLLK